MLGAKLTEILSGSETDEEGEDEEEEPENHSNDHQRRHGLVLPLVLPLVIFLAPTPGQVGVAVHQELDNWEPGGEENKPQDSHQVSHVKQPHSLRSRVLVGIGNNDVSRNRTIKL